MHIWRKLGSLATHWAHSEDSGQTGRMPRLIWVFDGRTVILLVLSWGGSNGTRHYYVSNTAGKKYHYIARNDSFICEPAHEIMALFDLRKLILQKRMHSHQVGLDIWFFVGPSIYFHTWCMRTAKALEKLRGCAGSPEPSLVACVISSIISWAGSYFSGN